MTGFIRTIAFALLLDVPTATAECCLDHSIIFRLENCVVYDGPNCFWHLGTNNDNDCFAVDTDICVAEKEADCCMVPDQTTGIIVWVLIITASAVSIWACIVCCCVCCGRTDKNPPLCNKETPQCFVACAECCGCCCPNGQCPSGQLGDLTKRFL